MIDSQILQKVSEYLAQEYPKHFNSKLAFAGGADIDERSIRRILNNEQNMSLEVLVKISSALKMKPSELLDKVGY